MAQASDLTGEFSTFFVGANKERAFAGHDHLELRHAETVIRRMLRSSTSVADPVRQRVHEAARILNKALVETESVRLSDVHSIDTRRRYRSTSFRLARRFLRQLSRLTRA
ncbi:MAG: hypothetical protein KDA91_14085 [Planctomycetaceae bacterium]|nr:hypothetical protein [Planctomycetaceae bacterium]